jgi:hypothetical protein
MTRLHNEKLYALYSPQIIRAIKKKEIGEGRLWQVCGKGYVHIGFWWGYLMEGDHLEDPGVVGGMILKWVFKK